MPSTTPAWPESIFGAPQMRPEPIDWDQVTRELGSDLPSDYRALADTYPAMYLDQHANLLRPGAVWGFELGTFVLATHRGGRAELLEFDPATRRQVEVPPDSPLRGPSRLLRWCRDDLPTEFYWNATDPDPETWTVLVADGERYSFWWHYKGSMSAFLTDALVERTQLPYLPRKGYLSPPGRLRIQHPLRFYEGMGYDFYPE